MISFKEYLLEDSRVDSVLHYLRDASFLNLYLRNTGNLTPAQTNVAKDLDSVIAEYKRMPPATLYRGVGLGFIKKNNIKVGDTLIDKGYISTTTSEILAKNPGYVHPDDRWMLVVKPQTKALYMKDYVRDSGNDKAIRLANEEDEWLFPRGTKIVINKMNEKTRKIWVTLKD